MLNRKQLKVIYTLFFLLGLQGCMTASQPRQLTPQEQELQNKMMQAMITRMSTNTVASAPSKNVNQTPQPIANVKSTLTIDELNDQIDSLQSNETAISFKRSRDGVKINGSMYLDPEGEIKKVGSNSLTGEFSYVIHTTGNDYIIKYNKAGSTAEAITLAYATIKKSGIKVTTVTGRNLSGKNIIPTSRGFIVTRDTSAFNFDPRIGLNNFSAAEGYHIAQYQNGDVSSTGYILLEKNPETNSANKLMGALSELASSVGVIEDKISEYILANIKTGNVIPINIHTSGKEITTLSDCKKKHKNSIINICSKSESHESLYQKNGLQNLSHYFWKVYWFNTLEGEYAVVQESGLKKITIINLETSKKVIAFERFLGISGFTASQTPKGQITIEAGLGFSTETIDDAVAFFNEKAI